MIDIFSKKLQRQIEKVYKSIPQWAIDLDNHYKEIERKKGELEEWQTHQ